MARIIYILLFISALNIYAGNAQNLRGVVIDHEELPVEGVAVIMQTKDSVFVDATITDSMGVFILNRSLEPCRLLMQHLMFETYTMDITDDQPGTIRMTPKEFALGEIVVKGERPVVKVEGGTLSYDVEQLIKDKTSTNAFEAIKELPGISGGDETIELIGAGSVSIILNGQLTTMSLPQLIQLLKSIPASRVKTAEVMYNAPAKYNIKGAMINVIIDSDVEQGNRLQGEVGALYDQKHYAKGGAHTNLLYSTQKLSLDLLVNAKGGRSYGGEEMIARHTLEDSVTEIEQSGRSKNKGQSLDLRLGMDYTFNNKDRLSASYYLETNKVKTERTSKTSYTPLDGSQPWTRQSDAYSKDLPDYLHNIRFQYDGHAGFMAGVDYTRYISPSDLIYHDTSSTGEEINMLNETEQNVSRYSVFANQTHTLGNWKLNYGAQGSFSKSDNSLEYLFDRGDGFVPDPELHEKNTQKDYTANVFAEASGSFGPKFTATIGLKGEYFKSDYKSLEEKMTLWSQWALFPTASLSYVFSPTNILQLNVSSDKVYPTYWALSPQRFPLNSYSEVVGNPELKPYRSYQTQFVYILRQKYMFLAFCNYQPDYFTQVPYQSDSDMKNVFSYENFDYSLRVGLAAIIPFHVGSFWNSRLTVQGFRMQEKSDEFHGMSFDRHAIIGAFISNNTFNLSSKPNIKLTVDGRYITKGAIQGIYDLGYNYEISAGIKWTSQNERAMLTLKANDIFRSAYPNTIEVNQGNQWSRMTKINDTHSVSLTFVYKFGGYKAKEHEKVDTSRFGQ